MSTTDEKPQPKRATRSLAAFRSRIGEFEILGEIGRGSMGIVYEARQLSLDRRVALKVFETSGKSDRTVERFKREAAAVAKLQHPGIVPVWAIGDDAEAGVLYYAMQLVEGQTLRDLMYRERIKPERAAAIAQKLAEALHYAHEQGVIHRDVKPANVLMTDAEQPLLTDFGLAKDLALAQLTQAGAVLGTPTHMSPEQARGDASIDARSDVYGLGSCLYEMLTFRLPFYGENLEDLLAKVHKHEPEPPRSIDPKIPWALEAITLRCLEKDRNRRYETAKEVAEELGRFLRGERVRTSGPPLGRRLARVVGRNLAAAVIGLALVVAGTYVLSLAAAKGLFASSGDGGGEVAPATGVVSGAEAGAAGGTATTPVPQGTRDGARGLVEEAREHRRRAGLAPTPGERRFYEDRALESLAAAMTLDPGDRTARLTRGEMLVERVLAARRAGEADEERRLLGLVKACDEGGRLERSLQREGALSLHTTQGDAKVSVDRFDPDGAGILRETRVLTDEPEPLVGRALPPGSYAATVRKKGLADAKTAFVIEPGGKVELEVRLLKPEEIPQGFVYVPTGPVILGGDALAPGALPREQTTLGGFLLAVAETTCAEYLAFLDDLPPDDAQRHAPRGGADQSYVKVFWPSPEGRWQMPPKWSPKRPVTGISHESAAAYAAWRSRRDQRAYRLPTEREWEKACRGADGRLHPWGPAEPGTLANVASSSRTAEALEVGITPSDVSLYGALDLMGNVAEWTGSPFDAAGLYFVVRGGAFRALPGLPRAAARLPVGRDEGRPYVGIRLAADLP